MTAAIAPLLVGVATSSAIPHSVGATAHATFTAGCTICLEATHSRVIASVAVVVSIADGVSGDSGNGNECRRTSDASKEHSVRSLGNA